jgi:hypothetical protein
MNKLTDAELDKTIAAARVYVSRREEGPVVVANPYDALDTATYALVQAVNECEETKALIKRQLNKAHVAEMFRVAKHAFIAGALQPPEAYDRDADFLKWWESRVEGDSGEGSIRVNAGAPPTAGGEAADGESEIIRVDDDEERRHSMSRPRSLYPKR